MPSGLFFLGLAAAVGEEETSWEDAAVVSAAAVVVSVVAFAAAVVALARAFAREAQTASTTFGGNCLVMSSIC